MYTYIYIYIHTLTHTHMHIYIYIYIHTYIYVYTHTWRRVSSDGVLQHAAPCCIVPACFALSHAAIRVIYVLIIRLVIVIVVSIIISITLIIAITGILVIRILIIIVSHGIAGSRPTSACRATPSTSRSPWSDTYWYILVQYISVDTISIYRFTLVYPGPPGVIYIYIYIYTYFSVSVECKLSECQSRGWMAVSAAALRGKGLRKRSVVC